jgi:hypothetical protein
MESFNDISSREEKRVVLIRDGSKLSSRVEKYLVKKNIKYDVLYSDNKESPFIFSPFSSYPLKGSIGFNIFKHSHKNSQNTNIQTNIKKPHK